MATVNLKDSLDLVRVNAIRIETYVAGISYENREENVRKLCLASPVELVPEFDNPYDSNAFKVIAEITGEEAQIGYLPRELARKMKGHLEHGSKILDCRVNTISSVTSGEGLDVMLEILLELNEKTGIDIPNETFKTEALSMKVVELDQEGLYEALKPRLTFLQQVIDYNKEKYGYDAFNDCVKYEDDRYTRNYWFKGWRHRLFSLEEGEVIRIREGLLHLLLQQISLKTHRERDGYAYEVQLSFDKGDMEYFLDSLRQLAEMDEDRSEVVMELLNDNNNFDYGYYNNIRGDEFNSAVAEYFHIFESEEALEKEIERYIEEGKEDFSGEAFEDFKDVVESTVREITIPLPSGRFALIFYEDIDDAVDGLF